ncbi:uncharacterized protein LOC112563530 isoform X32 [Pomacea canaliculata]|uniref:uncharacterized protein LOC112563530 isoform X32 n=1 Tax=Pomacea canaliculata TaxID=400727 RepID=UPI000D731BCF|nr:uncharacterized protein LOC112563530 isoform X32 [Pomacea canaliculata]
MDEESASKFINALIKSVQTLCHGYVDFNNGVEIIGYINLSVDKGSSFDYVLKEKVCKNEENSTLFISNSFHAQPKPDKPVKAKNGQVETHISQRRHSVDTSESNQLSSAISSISTVLSGSHSQEKSRSIFSAKDSPASSSSSSSHHIQSTAKRKGEDDVNHDHPPKAANLSHESSSQHFFHPESSPHVSATSSPVDSKPSMSDVAGNVGESSRRTSTVTSEEMQPHIAGTMLPQTATVTSDANSDLGVNLASSVLERIDDQSNSEMQEKDDSDLDLEVTFIKEEYVEGERSACEFQNSGGGQYGRGPDQRASTSSDSMADTPLYPVALHTSAAAATFAPGSHEMAAMAQHYSGIPSSSLGIGAGPSTSHQPGPSGMRGNVTQQQALPLPPGTRPACGYVHPDDAKKWMAALTGLGGGRGYSKSVAKEDIERLLREKHTLKEVAHLLNISRPTLYKMLRKYRLDSAFKFMTNEQIMHLMRGIVTEFPQAAVDVEVMLEKLNQRSIFSINPKRVLACLKKLNSD